MLSALLLPALTVASLRGATVDSAPLTGKVLDARGGLVRVSVGTRHGAKIGTSLRAYRFEPRPQYLANLEVVVAYQNYSLARLAPGIDPPLPVESGDSVASLTYALLQMPDIRYFAPPYAEHRLGAIIDLTQPKPRR